VYNITRNRNCPDVIIFFCWWKPASTLSKRQRVHELRIIIATIENNEILTDQWHTINSDRIWNITIQCNGTCPYTFTFFFLTISYYPHCSINCFFFYLHEQSKYMFFDHLNQLHIFMQMLNISILTISRIVHHVYLHYHIQFYFLNQHWSNQIH